MPNSKTRAMATKVASSAAMVCNTAPVIVGLTDAILRSQCQPTAPAVDLYIRCTSDFGNNMKTLSGLVLNSLGSMKGNIDVATDKPDISTKMGQIKFYNTNPNDV